MPFPARVITGIKNSRDNKAGDKLKQFAFSRVCIVQLIKYTWLFN